MEHAGIVFVSNRSVGSITPTGAATFSPLRLPKDQDKAETSLVLSQNGMIVSGEAADLHLYRFSGEVEALEVSPHSDYTTATAVSNAARLLAFQKGRWIELYDMDTLEHLTSIDTTLSVAKVLSFNRLGTKILAAGWSNVRGVAMYDTTTGAETILHAGYSYGVGCSPTEDKYIVLASSGGAKAYAFSDPTTPLFTFSIALHGSGTPKHVPFSIDGTLALISTYDKNSVKFFDMVNETTIDAPCEISSPTGVFDDTYCYITRKSNTSEKNRLYRVEAHSSSVTGLWQEINAPDISQLLHEEDMQPYFVSGTITDTAEEDIILVSVLNTDNQLIASELLAPGTTQFSIKVPTYKPVQVLLSGKPFTVHEAHKAYSVGDIIIISTSDYSYECTTAGVTALIPPAYPTSGTVTDGSAVFTVRHKLAKPNMNFPVYPAPAMGGGGTN